MRILHLISGAAIGDQSGGAELHAIQVARHFDKTIIDPVIYAVWSYDSPAEAHWLETLSREEITVEGLTPLNDDSSRVSRQVFRDLWTAVHRIKPHIIHSHSERFDSLNSLLRVIHPIHPKAVRTIHLDRQWQSRPQLGPIINSTLFPAIFSFEMAVSQVIYQQLLDSRFRSEDKIGLCYNGIDAAAFSRKHGEIQGDIPDGFPLGQPRIGIVGRLSNQKGHADLIRAIEIINPQHQVHLVIVGDGPLRTDLESLTRQLDLGEYIHFTGTHNNIWAVWPYLDLFVLPSYWEGFPTVILEAMSQDVPVVATDIPGNRELIQSGSTGLLVPPGDPKRLAEQILFMLENPTASSAMTRRAKEFASQFTIQNTSKCYSDIYQRILR
jgi:glycosyltransferase involved in cell wall biosynthesis